MPSHTFKGWEHIDGSKVSREEIELSFEQVMQKARLIEESHKASLAERRTIWIRRAIFTAAAIVLLVISPIAALHIIDRQTDAVMNGYTAQRGEIGEVLLPDGSTVTLNSGSTLSYPEKFGRRRVVRLSGEAVFTVTASRRHTFTVETDGMDVTAHGTVFNVRNYPEETAASATLFTPKFESVLHAELVLFDGTQKLFYFIFFGHVCLLSPIGQHTQKHR